MRIEDEHPDVLQNIEFEVAMLYRKHPGMTDYDVIRAYEALLDYYAAQRIGRQPLRHDLSDLERGMFDASKKIIEWRMGRAPFTTGRYYTSEQTPDPVDIKTIILCLKRLLTSARKWNKHTGRRGYLDFMSQFIV